MSFPIASNSSQSAEDSLAILFATEITYTFLSRLTLNVSVLVY